MSLIDGIKNAIASHGEWKNMLRITIATGEIDAHMSAIRAEDQCGFGKWLLGQSIADKEKYSLYHHQARQLHAAFHEAASKTVQLAASGKKEIALNMLEVHGEFTVASAALTSCMLSWLIEVKNNSAEA